MSININSRNLLYNISLYLFRVNYRQGPDYNSHPGWVRHGSLLVGGAMWWWVLWHFWHEPEHITGEFEQPDPKLWTDKELGIPPDDFEED